MMWKTKVLSFLLAYQWLSVPLFELVSITINVETNLALLCQRGDKKEEEEEEDRYIYSTDKYFYPTTSHGELEIPLPS